MGSRTRLPGGGEVWRQDSGEGGSGHPGGDVEGLVAGAHAVRSGRLAFLGGGDLEAVDFWMFVEELEWLHRERHDLTAKEFGLARAILRVGMGLREMGPRPAEETLARRRVWWHGHGGSPGVTSGAAADTEPAVGGDGVGRDQRQGEVRLTVVNGGRRPALGSAAPGEKSCAQRVRLETMG